MANLTYMFKVRGLRNNRLKEEADEITFERLVRSHWVQEQVKGILSVGRDTVRDRETSIRLHFWETVSS